MVRKRECPKCGKLVPKQAWIDGKKKNLQRRKYCFDCSPYGLHNTRQLETDNTRQLETDNTRQLETDAREPQINKCQSCGKEFRKKKGTMCYACDFQKKFKYRVDRVYDIVGYACWYCGYNKGAQGRRMLDFHHVDPKKRIMSLSAREILGRWDKVFEEMQKCALLCCRCHQEYHAGLIDHDVILLLYKKKWEKIKQRQTFDIDKNGKRWDNRPENLEILSASGD